jgi:hypothetical protein
MKVAQFRQELKFTPINPALMNGMPVQGMMKKISLKQGLNFSS